MWSLSTERPLHGQIHTTPPNILRKRLAPQSGKQLQQEHEGRDVVAPMVPPLAVLPHSWEMVPGDYPAALRRARLILPPQQLSLSPFFRLSQEPGNQWALFLKPTNGRAACAHNAPLANGKLREETHGSSYAFLSLAQEEHVSVLSDGPWTVL